MGVNPVPDSILPCRHRSQTALSTLLSSRMRGPPHLSRAPTRYYYENSPFRVRNSLPPRRGKVRMGVNPVPDSILPCRAVREPPFLKRNSTPHLQ